MTDTTADDTVVPFPNVGKKDAASHERIWGKRVIGHGYTGVPSILIRSQARLGINAVQMTILMHLLDHWFDPSRPPFPSKRTLADRMGVKSKTIQNHMRELEKAGYVQREVRRTAAGDFNSNVYHLDGLVAKIKEIEPDFARVRATKQAAKSWAETPKGRRSAIPSQGQHFNP